MKKCEAHHWHIEKPDGETSKGICQNCGAEREFKNTIEKALEKPIKKTNRQTVREE